MFDFGFSELIVVAVVMLIVVGPERLPKVARTAGHLLGRLQRYVSDVKSDIQREMQLEDLKKLQQQVEEQARELESSMRGQVAAVESDLNNTVAEVKAVSGEVPAPAPAQEAAQPPVPGVVPPVAVDDVAVPAEPSPQLELGLDPAAAPVRPVEKA